ncbi:HtaA domain-containing protein [Nocardiopsis sp. CC223A]|uniref:HtaA domain-containing protein n=1 Tax=Nocardiopsis sp. CC223A TaxID=3044051 RepID=UPI00278BEA61|nr:HtaA domain-containing protein [Nocardiopsis sp. CC223A]
MTLTTTRGAAPGRRVLRTLTSASAVTALAAGLIAVSAPAASAAPVSGGSAAWGVKESFRNYVSGIIANGGYETSDGATKLSDGLVDFPTAGGDVDDAFFISGEVEFSGTVVFTGHDYGQGPVLEIRISDPRVEFDGDTGTVYADVTSREFHGANPFLPPGDLIEYGEVAVTELTGVGIDVTGTEIDFTSTGGTLHPDAVEPFAGFYDAGTEMDPISFTTDLS